MRAQLNDLIKLIKGQWRAIEQNMYLYCDARAIILECATLYSNLYLYLTHFYARMNNYWAKDESIRSSTVLSETRNSSIILVFILLCWVNVGRNVSMEIIAKMLTQTNVSGLEVLVVNKACIYSCVSEVLRMKKRNIFNVHDRKIWWRHTYALQREYIFPFRHVTILRYILMFFACDIGRGAKSEWLVESHVFWTRQPTKTDWVVLFHSLWVGRALQIPKCMCTSTEKVSFSRYVPFKKYGTWGQHSVVLWLILEVDRFIGRPINRADYLTFFHNRHRPMPEHIKPIIKQAHLRAAQCCCCCGTRVTPPLVCQSNCHSAGRNR